MNLLSGTDKNLSKIYLIYYAILSAIFVASFFPDSRVWGYNHWAFIPSTLKYFLLTIGIVAPIITGLTLKKIGGETDDAPSDKKFYLISGIILVSFVLLFYFFRSTTHFLGDGYETLSGIETENRFTKFSNLGAVEINRFVYSLIPTKLIDRALMAIQSISYFSGILFVIISTFLAKNLSKKLTDRVILIIALLSCGQMLLFFGYVENYSLFNAIIFAFIVTGFLNLKNKLNIIYPTVLALISPFFHIFGIILFPPLVLLWLIKTTKLSVSELLMKRTFKYSLFGLIFLGIVGFIYAYNNYLYFQLAIVPYAGNRFVLDGYTIFSTKHLLDIANQSLILLPALPLLLYLFIKNVTKKLFEDNSFVFLVLLSIEAFLLLFLFDPKLGMPRDWDLFAAVGIPISTLLILFIISSKDKIKCYRQVLMLSTILGWLVLTPRLYINVNPEAALDQVQSYFEVDVRKSMNYIPIVNTYAKNNGHTDIVDSLRVFWNKNYREYQLNEQASNLMNQNKFVQAISLLKQAIKINPAFAAAYFNLGKSYNQINKFDDAREILETALGLNPYSKLIFRHVGYSYEKLGDLDKAEKSYLQAYERDSKDIMTIRSLANIYKLRGNKKKFEEYTKKLLLLKQSN